MWLASEVESAEDVLVCCVVWVSGVWSVDRGRCWTVLVWSVCGVLVDCCGDCE